MRKEIERMKDWFDWAKKNGDIGLSIEDVEVLFETIQNHENLLNDIEKDENLNVDIEYFRDKYKVREKMEHS